MFEHNMHFIGFTIVQNLSEAHIFKNYRDPIKERSASTFSNDEIAHYFIWLYHELRLLAWGRSRTRDEWSSAFMRLYMRGRADLAAF